MLDLPIPELSRAVLIGASRFTGLPALPAVHNNLLDLAEALTNPQTGILQASSCTIVDTPDSTAAFMRMLRTAAKQAEDFLLVYYAGHGVRDQIHDERLYLAVRETDPDGPEGTAIPFEAVRDVIEDSRARTRVLILDCCYSGLAMGAMSTTAVDVQEVAVGGTAVLTSSPKNKQSLSPPGDRHTAFTGELITLINGGTRIPGEALTVDTAFRSLRAVLARRRLPEPKLKLTDTSGAILLRRTSLPPPKPAPPPLVWQKHTSPEPRPLPPILPVPSPTPRQPPRDGRLGRRFATALVADSGWLLLCIGLALGISYTIGGYWAAISETGSAPAAAGNDSAGGAAGLALIAICGSLICWRIIRTRRKGRRWPTLQQLSPQLDAKLSAFRHGALILGMLFFVGAALAIPFAANAPVDNGSNSVSPLAVTVSMTCLMIQGAVACGYALYRSRRTHGRGTPPAVP